MMTMDYRNMLDYAQGAPETADIAELLLARVKELEAEVHVAKADANTANERARLAECGATEGERILRQRTEEMDLRVADLERVLKEAKAAKGEVQAMDSAPREGENILLYRLNEWENGCSMWSDIGWFDQGGWWVHTDQSYTRVSTPDAWVELPRSPSKEELLACRAGGF